MQATAQQIATIINNTTQETGMTAAIHNGKCFVHVPVITSQGFHYEVRIIESEEDMQQLGL